MKLKIAQFNVSFCFRKTKSLSNSKSHKLYGPQYEESVMFWASKLSTCYIDGVTLGMKIQSIAYLLEGGGGMSIYIY